MLFRQDSLTVRALAPYLTAIRRDGFGGTYAELQHEGSESGVQLRPGNGELHEHDARFSRPI
ncbi:MAG: hypothetical protein AMXMBFR4_33820 [Candidatus Hydrogenedentota bacterium]